MRIGSKKNKATDPRLKYERLCPYRTTLLFGMHAFAICALPFTSWPNATGMLIMYFLTGCLGLTVGYHRLLTHRSFKCKVWLRNVLALLGTLTMQGGPTLWAATHRTHHDHTNSFGDPHSATRGFLWSHFLWMLHRSPNGFRFSQAKAEASDVANTRFIRLLDNHYLGINFAAAFGFWVITRDIGLLLWAFPLRIVLFWHATWLVNSFAHYAGSAKSLRSSRNSFWLTVIMFGEGWHDNHHEHPRRASFQTNKYDLDLGYLTIKSFEIFGWATVPTQKFPLESRKSPWSET